MCPTVTRIRKRFAKHGLDTAVQLNHPLYARYSAETMAAEGRHSATTSICFSDKPSACSRLSSGSKGEQILNKSSRGT